MNSPYIERKSLIRELVPSRLILFNCFVLTYYLMILVLSSNNLIECKPRNQRNKHLQHSPRHNLPEATIYDDYSLVSIDDNYGFESSKPNAKLYKNSDTAIVNDFTEHYVNLASQDLVSPAKVFEEHQLHERQNGFSAPIFDLQRANQRYDQHQQQKRNILNVPFENSNILEPFNEPGSGGIWDLQQPNSDESVSRNEDSASIYSTSVSASFANGSLNSSVSKTEDKTDYGPVLARRIPKLVVVAGQFWRYTVPADTFYDHDGDLRRLKTSLLPLTVPLNGSNEENLVNTYISTMNYQAIDQYFNWLQYDPNSQTFYGYPTEDDSGRHEYTLFVADQWNSTSNETIEINVRQHQSTRAFTHLFRINDIIWNSQKYPSMVNTLLDLTKRINSGLFADFSPATFIMKSYNFRKVQHISGTLNSSNGSSDDLSLLTVEWSNATIPIHPCDLTKLENIVRSLADISYSNWSLESGQRSDLSPSQNLIKALEPDFRPRSIDVELLGACSNNELSDKDDSRSNNNIETLVDGPRVRMKIGKLNWFLGEPIMYKIPYQIFEADKGRRDSRNLSLNLHTIDGANLESNTQYSFLEFDRETRIVYGMPYDIDQHTGPKELLLTATHPITNQTAREVFVINIERQDLTTINNRAFHVSLYFLVRSGLFGPHQRVTLIQQIVKSLGIRDLEFAHDQESPQMTVIEIQKFSFVDYKKLDYTTSKNLLNPLVWDESIEFHLVNDDISSLERNLELNGDNLIDDINSKNFLFKITWTNESIGHDGNCPVEVIKGNILEALERTLLKGYVPELDIAQDAGEKSSNESLVFYKRLRSFFEPDLDLVHLRFEPLNACQTDLVVHDAGNEKFADRVDSSAIISTIAPLEEVIAPSTPAPKIENVEGSFNSDEYWSIVVLVILVVALVFVIMMFFMGMHTYKINQEKKIELQVRLAQARQNSMFLSSMILADQATGTDGMTVAQSIVQSNQGKIFYNVNNDERASRKPVILDNEKHLWTNNGPLNNAVLFKQTASQFNGHAIQTVPLRPNMTITLDSIASNMNNPSINSMFNRDVMMRPSSNQDEARKSVTLNRKQSYTNRIGRYLPRQASMNQINHSQSILTVASLAGPVQIMPRNDQPTAIPILYTHLPIVSELSSEVSRDTAT